MTLPSEDLYTYNPPARKQVSVPLPSEDLYTSYPPERVAQVVLTPAQRNMPDLSNMPIHTPSVTNGDWLDGLTDDITGWLDSLTNWLTHLFADPLPTIALLTGGLFGGMSAGSLIMIILKITSFLGGTQQRREYGEGTWKAYSIPEQGYKEFMAYLLENKVKVQAGKVVDGRYHFTVAAYHLGKFRTVTGAYARSDGDI